MSKQLGGFKPWVAQRISAIYLALFFTVAVVWSLTSGFPETHEAWRELIGSPVLNLALLAFFFALLYHAWIGIRDVIVDYLHPPAIKFSVLTIFAVGLIVCGLWALRVLISAV